MIECSNMKLPSQILVNPNIYIVVMDMEKHRKEPSLYERRVLHSLCHRYFCHQRAETIIISHDKLVSLWLPDQQPAGKLLLF
jgi:hypothetical protein